MPHNEMHHDWLIREIRNGLQKLVSLSLDSPPSADLAGATLLMWVETITHGRVFDEARDAERFRQAFRTLANRIRRWPAPVDFLEAMPRIESPQSAKAIEGPQSREVGMRTIAELAEKLKIEPVTPYTEVDA